jgi:hypothetical protein
MKLVHLLTRSVLMHPEVTSVDLPLSFCLVFLLSLVILHARGSDSYTTTSPAQPLPPPSRGIPFPTNKAIIERVRDV